MLMVDSIGFDIRYPFSDVRAEGPCFANAKMNKKVLQVKTLNLCYG